MKINLYIHNEEDRLMVARILVKNGYIVRIGRRREPGKKAATYFVEAEDGKTVSEG